jgi:GT2 family glycosyltransferase/glycosyltransferase involved in cell wall biosynthesis
MTTKIAYDAAQFRSKINALKQQMNTLELLIPNRVPEAQILPSGGAIDLTERYGLLYNEAAVKRGKDFVWLGVINYDFLIQRPQHFASELANAGHRVLYIAIEFEPADVRGRFRVEAMPHEGVFVVRLRISSTLPANIYGGFTDQEALAILASLDELLAMLNVTAPRVVVQYPSWHYVAAGIPGAIVIHDCLDFVGGFSNVPPAMIDLGHDLLKNADVVLAASASLAEIIAPLRRPIVVRNAADVSLFSGAARFDESRPAGKRPLIGYFGAIAEWFSVEWIEHCARSRPNWDFVLIGHTQGIDLQALEEFSNVTMLGKRPYSELPEYLSQFDVAVIPFKVNELTRCTNPVKLYEYMAAGKPVVAGPMPEVINLKPLVYITNDANEFEHQIQRALDEDSPVARRRRHDWALEHTWENRAKLIVQAIDSATPRVSVVILAYNQWQFTEKCLYSVLALSEYDNLEVIVVDNGSTDETLEKLQRTCARDKRVSVIRNKENLGFAAGNNVGLRAATGDYVILLNNDTYVTKGWVRDLIRPMTLDSQVGMTGPLTNNIGNEQKIAIHYDSMQEMGLLSRRFVRNHLRERLATHNLAFFCVAIRRETLDDVGLLDESYGLGFFKDDDYCQRVQQAGYRIEVVDDVFVHHHLSASFTALGVEQKAAQMAKNKAIYERRWGSWRPHTYRNAPHFGER